jgi:hypothetical protein
MLSLAKFSKMDLRPEPRSTYGIGHRCEKSVAGMGRRRQWQPLRCSSWRNVQQGECKQTSSVPLGNGNPFPKPLQEETKKRCEKVCPFTKRTETATKQSRGTFLAGAHNEGKSGYMGSLVLIPYNGLAVYRRTLNLDRKGPAGITSKRGTRHTCKGAPILGEENEPVNLGSSARNDKTPRSANVQAGRRSNRSSLSRLISGPYTKGCSRAKLQVAKHYQNHPAVNADGCR